LGEVLHAGEGQDVKPRKAAHTVFLQVLQDPRVSFEEGTTACPSALLVPLMCGFPMACIIGPPPLQALYSFPELI
jgi:hypothetical protein